MSLKKGKDEKKITVNVIHPRNLRGVRGWGEGVNGRRKKGRRKGEEEQVEKNEREKRDGRCKEEKRKRK